MPGSDALGLACRIPYSPLVVQRVRTLVASLSSRDRALFAVLALGLAWACAMLLARIVFVLDPDSYGGDPTFYFTIGRSLLNGLTPYADIFDPKPPGVFLLAAASFALFDTPYLGNLVTVAVLLLYPALLGWWCWRGSATRSREDRFLLTGTGVLAGIGLSLWSSLQAGVWQPESFGNAFALLYILATMTWRERMTLVRTLLAALLMFLAIGCKEPYVLTLAAAALVVDARPRVLLRTFVVPLLIAGIAGVLLLLALGWFEPYWSLYLPAVVGVRIKFSVPVWQRALYVLDLWQPLGKISSLAFPLMTALPLLRIGDAARRVGKSAVWIAVPVLLAAYLSVTAVGLAGNFPTLTYSASLSPFFSAITVALLSVALRNADAWSHQLAMALVVLFALFAASFPWARVYPGVSVEERSTIRTLETRAVQLDALLHNCGLSRYLYAVNPPQPLLPAYTHSSPLNHFPYREVDKTPFGMPFTQKTLERLSESQVILVNPEGFLSSNDLGDIMGGYMAQNFSTTPWPCAESSMPLPGYMVLFRTGSGVISIGNAQAPEGMMPIHVEQ